MEYVDDRSYFQTSTYDRNMHKYRIIVSLFDWFDLF